MPAVKTKPVRAILQVKPNRLVLLIGMEHDCFTRPGDYFAIPVHARGVMKSCRRGTRTILCNERHCYRNDKNLPRRAQAGHGERVSLLYRRTGGFSCKIP